MIGCVLVQAGTGGEPAIAKMFDTTDWFLAPEDGMHMMDASIEQWQILAEMPREARVARWKAFA